MQKHIVVINTSVLTDTDNLSSNKVKRIEAVWSEQALREEAIKNLNTNRN